MRLLLLLLTCLTLSVAQAQVTRLPAWEIYRGNTGYYPIGLSITDALKPVTAIAYLGPNARPIVQQPTVSRVGMLVQVKYELSDGLPQLGYVEVKLSGQTRYAFELKVNKNITSAGSPPQPDDPVYLDLYGQLLFYNF